MMSWAGKNRGTIAVFGHSHGNINDRLHNSLDVGVDTNNFKPYHISEVIEKSV